MSVLTGPAAARIARRLCALACVAAAGVGLVAGSARGVSRSTTARPVVVVNFNSAVDTIAVRYLGGALDDAANANAQVVIIRIDTPGGLVSSTRKIVADIFASPVPVVVYVAPSGSRAASAGTFISAASSFLAMAPATNIGAAAVVGAQGENLASTEAKKATQDAAALMRSIAVRRHRPVIALQATVFQAKAYSAEEAVRLGIANLEVATLDALVRNLDGRVLQSSTGPKTVQTAGAPISEVNMSFFERLLSFLADPNLVFLLLSVGGLALIVELWSPGTWVPGSLGVICLLLAFAGLGNLPFSWAGLALILLGIGFLGFELHAPGHLFFGIAGTTSIILGGIFLVGYFGHPGLPGYNPSVSRWLLVSVAVVVGAIVFLLAREVHLSHHGERYVSPLEGKALVGAVGEVSTRLAPSGEVWVGGEAWQAELQGGGTAEPGERVRVTAVDGLRLLVQPLGENKNGRAKKSAAKPS